MTIIERKIDVCLRFIAACDEESRSRAVQEAREILKAEDDQFFARNNSADCYIRGMVEDLLVDVGVPSNLSGYDYLVEAIIMAMNDHEIMHGHVVSVLYRDLAKMFEKPAHRIERNIGHAVMRAFDNGDLKMLDRLFGNSISRDKGVATNSQFIATMANAVRRQVYGGRCGDER